MLTLPISLVASLALVWLVLARVKRNDWRIDGLAILVLMIAAQGGIVALAQHWKVMAFLWIQPVTALLIPPTAWLAFQSNMRRDLRLSDMRHLLIPALGVLLAATEMRWLFDPLVPLVFAAYGGTIFTRLMRAPDDMPRARLGSHSTLAQVWRILAIALVVSALNDVLIVIVQIAKQSHLQAWLLSLMSSAMLGALGGFSLLPEPAPPAPPRVDDPAQSIEDSEILSRLIQHMNDKRAYLDPDLTLERLARQIRVPAKQLSAAINRQTGENVSRYVNTLRIEAAAAGLIAGHSVTEAMLASGFATKSNFNREFLRVKGQSPSLWREAQAHR